MDKQEKKKEKKEKTEEFSAKQLILITVGLLISVSGFIVFASVWRIPFLAIFSLAFGLYVISYIITNRRVLPTVILGSVFPMTITFIYYVFFIR